MARPLASLLLATFLFAACGGGEGDGAGGDTAGGDGHDHSAMEQADSAHGGSFGHAGDPADATQTLEVEATDRLAFDPAAVEVAAGDTVTFVITNSGKLPHEFVLGDAAYQDQHAEGMSMDHGDGNAVSLAPGKTGKVTWTFVDAGEVLYGCHVDGHYSNGMRGVVTVR